MKSRYFYKSFALILSVLLVIESFGIQVEAQETDLELIEDCGSTCDGTDGSIDGADVNLDATDVIFASGTYYGMDWTINTNGLLQIEGKYDGGVAGRSWNSYASFIKSAKVSATDVSSTYKWFADLTALETVDLSRFDSGRVLNAGHMFSGCSSLKQIQFGNFKTYNIKDMSYMFNGCESLEKLDLSSFNTSKVTSMRYMFAKCTSLTKINLSGFDTSKVTDMTGMFYGCSMAKSITTNDFDTTNVTNMSSMFEGCHSLKIAFVDGFNTAKVINMSSMFQDCTNLKKVNVSKFKTHNVKYMSAMFSGCAALPSVDVRGFNTSSVTTMAHMFSDCQSLEKIDVSNFKTYMVTDMDGMFFKCYQLASLDISAFNMGKVTSADAMLGRCGSLRQINTPVNLKLEVELPVEMRTADGGRQTLLPQGKTASVTLTAITFDIEPIEDQVYTGAFIMPTVTVKNGEEVLTEGVDYTVSYRNHKVVASSKSEKAPTVTVKGKGRYTGSIKRSFNIVAKEITEENTVVEGMIWPQNGKVQKKTPVLMVDGRKLTVKKDFLVIYGDGSVGAYTKPGSYKVTIKGIGNYTGTMDTKLVILGANQIRATDLVVSGIATCVLEADKPATPTPKVKYNGTVLQEGVDYELIYQNNDKVGTATVTIKGLQNAESHYVCGSVTKKFKIKGTSIRKAQVDFDKKFTYTGLYIYPKVTLTIDGKALVEDKDYTIAYTDNVNVGYGKITITGCGMYAGTIREKFRITPDIGTGDLLDIRMVDADGVVAYTKNGAEPEVVVSLHGKTLVENVDYKLKYIRNNKIADASAKNAPQIIISGKGNYSFTRKVKFGIEKKSISSEELNILVQDKVKTSSNLRSKPVITDANGARLSLSKDYVIVGYKIGGVAYDEDNIPKDATRGIVTVRGVGNYTGEVSVMYRITEKSINDVTVLAKNLEYKGQAAEYTPELIAYGMLILRDNSTGKELVCGQDFEIVGYKNNEKIGRATMTIKGLGDYGGTRNVTYKIVRQKIDG